ncbi:MAG: SRPBCC domain-containing protein [Myxococcaceae bacterium]
MKGTATTEGGTVTLRFERLLRHSPEHVWEALTTFEGVKDWLMCVEATIEPRAGGTIELVSGPPRYRSTGKILRWEPPRVFEHEWKVAPVPEMPNGENLVFRYELSPEQSHTRLVVTVSGVSQGTAPGFLPGLHVFIERLAAQLDRAPLPDFGQRFEALLAEYPQWGRH